MSNLEFSATDPENDRRSSKEIAEGVGSILASNGISLDVEGLTKQLEGVEAIQRLFGPPEDTEIRHYY